MANKKKPKKIENNSFMLQTQTLVNRILSTNTNRLQNLQQIQKKLNKDLSIEQSVENQQQKNIDRNQNKKAIELEAANNSQTPVNQLKETAKEVQMSLTEKTILEKKDITIENTTLDVRQGPESP
jgi:hypothetical protein